MDKTDVYQYGVVRHLEFKILNFGHRILVIVPVHFTLAQKISPESNQILIKCDDITIFFFIQNFAKIVLSAAELRPK